MFCILMVIRSLRRWPKINPALGKHLVSAGYEGMIRALTKNEMNRALGHRCAHIG